MLLEKTARATAFHESSLPHVLREAANWLEDPPRSLVGDLIVTEDPDEGWWVVVYWYPTVEEHGN